MLRVKWEVGASMTDLIIRSNSTLKHRLHSNTDIKHEWWDERCVQLRLEGGGHGARLSKLDPAMLTYRVCSHWSYSETRHASDQHDGRQHHGRHLHIWRWEYYLYKHLVNTWFYKALSRDGWKACVTETKETIISKLGPR